MRSRLVALATTAILLGGCVTEPGEAERRRPQGGGERNRRPAQTEVVAPAAGTYLAFDVRPRQHRITTRYVLEITDSSGAVTLQDLKKPTLVQRRSIVVQLPPLAPGDYNLVVIAEGPGGASRSAPMLYQVKAP